MLSEHNRAFKEWAAVCEAMQTGRQILLIRKGGIREDRGVFTMNDREFFLMPTYDHQSETLLKPEYNSLLKANRAPASLATTTIRGYAVVDTILTARDEAQVNRAANEFIWNDAYVRQRFDFNPYDPLYLILLRVYSLPEALTLPMLADYGGCKSWVTLDRSLSTREAKPALSDEEFAARRALLLAALTP